MKKNIYTNIVAWTIFLIGVQTGTIYSNAVKEITSIDQMQNSQPRVIEFYSPKCPHCQNMMPIFEQVAQAHKEVQFCRVNVLTPGININQIVKDVTKNKSKEIHGVPTFIFIDKKGNMSGNPVSGGMGQGALEQRVAALR